MNKTELALKSWQFRIVQIGLNVCNLGTMYLVDQLFSKVFLSITRVKLWIFSINITLPKSSAKYTDNIFFCICGEKKCFLQPITLFFLYFEDFLLASLITLSESVIMWFLHCLHLLLSFLYNIKYFFLMEIKRTELLVWSNPFNLSCFVLPICVQDHCITHQTIVLDLPVFTRFFTSNLMKSAEKNSDWCIGWKENSLFLNTFFFFFQMKNKHKVIHVKVSKSNLI